MSLRGTQHTLLSFLYILFFIARQPLVGQGLLIVKTSRLHSDTPHSVGRLWTSDQPDAQSSTWQHTTLTTTDIHAPGTIRTRIPSKRAAADPRFSPRSYWDRLLHIEVSFIVNRGRNDVKVRILLEICVRSSLETRRNHCLSYWPIRPRIVKLGGMSCEMSAILSGCNKNHIVRFESKISQTWNTAKICPVGVVPFHKEKQAEWLSVIIGHFLRLICESA